MPGLLFLENNSSKKETMDYAGKVISSQGSEVELLVSSDKIEVGSILKLDNHYAIVSSMRYREDDKIGGRHKLTASLQVFGEKTMKGFRRIKKPVEPYIKASLPDASELESLLHTLDEISFGNVSQTEARAYVDGGQYDRHTAILASTGAGKSYLTANLVKEYALKGLPNLVVDTHGEFLKLLSNIKTGESLNIQVYTVGGRRQGLEDFTIPVSSLSCRDFTHFTSLNDNQLHALDLVLSRLYRDKGDEYSMKDLVAAADEIVDEAGTSGVRVHEETAKALSRRLAGLERTFRDVFTVDGTDINRLVEPYKCTVIDTSVSTQGVRRSIVSYLSKRLLEGRINKSHSLDGETIDHPVLFTIEEAHNYGGATLTHSCKYQLQRIASEGRKFGVGLLVVSQKPSKIDEEILSQCNTGIYMHITNPRDKDHIRRSFESISDDVIRELDSLDVAECIITGAMLKLPFLMCKVDEIPVEKQLKTKFNFNRPQKKLVGGFDYD